MTTNDRATTRCTIITTNDDPSELTVVDAWFRDFADQITSIGDNEGCGCCVNIWTVEATAEAFAALPDSVKSASTGEDSGRQPSHGAH